MAKNQLDISKHMLVPSHTKLVDKDKKTLLEKYHITLRELPQINIKDPAIQHLTLKEGDVVKITRPSKTAGEAIFYRRAVNA